MLHDLKHFKARVGVCCSLHSEKKGSCLTTNKETYPTIGYLENDAQFGDQIDSDRENRPFIAKSKIIIDPYRVFLDEICFTPAFM
jgi:hypothetical protein